MYVPHQGVTSFLSAVTFLDFCLHCVALKIDNGKKQFIKVASLVLIIKMLYMIGIKVMNKTKKRQFQI